MGMEFMKIMEGGLLNRIDVILPWKLIATEKIHYC